MKTDILGVRFDTLSPEEMVHTAASLIEAGGFHYAVTPNPEFLLAARKNEAFRTCLLYTSFPQEHIVAARLGGDEFVAFFHSYSTKDELEKAVQVLAGQSERLSIQVPGGILVPVQYSIGYAHYPQKDTNYHALLRMADERMYQNKRLRKGLSSSAVPTVTPAWTKE